MSFVKGFEVGGRLEVQAGCGTGMELERMGWNGKGNFFPEGLSFSFLVSRSKEQGASCPGQAFGYLSMIVTWNNFHLFTDLLNP